MQNRIELTSDGSHSVFSEKFGALYHSKHGAIQESQHVFLDAGLDFKFNGQDHINILEMGMGTGLNLLLTYVASEKLNCKIQYETIEAYPISIKEARSLNYLRALQREDLHSTFENIHLSEWGVKEKVSDNFTYIKHKTRLQDVDLKSRFDIVFYDAFAPQCQEELWTPEIFDHISGFLNDQAILVTYCAKGSFKRALMSAGFTIEKIPGPPGKREMIRGTYHKV